MGQIVCHKNINILFWGIFTLALMFLLFSEMFDFGLSTTTKLFIILIVSAFIVIKSANFLIGAISDYGKKTGFSEYLIGLFVLAIGTTLPDLSTGIIASLTNNGSLLLGDAIGANILDMTIVLGCTIFYGTIIASASAYFLLPISSYFLLPRRGHKAKLIGTIQYNMGRLEELSTSVLEALKSESVKVIEDAIKHMQSE